MNDAGPEADVSQIPDARPDSFIDLFDVFPLPDGGCPGCIRDRCGTQINACFNNPACLTGLFCTLQTCAGGLLGDGGFSPANIACVLGCFNGDQNLAFTAIGAFTCLTMTCGNVCTFFDAGTDARPPNPDGQMPPDAGADASSDDASLDVATPDSGPAPDSGDQDADGAPPSSDAADDGVAPDATAGDGVAPDSTIDDAAHEASDPPETAPPIDAAPESAPPGEGGAD